MNKNVKVVSVVAIVAVVVVAAIYYGYDAWKGRQRCFDCGDGQRCTIDVRQFATQYSAYSLELEASLSDKAKVSAKINPVQLQQLSEALQTTREFRKYVVSGFNACAITKDQYGQIGKKFQALDSLAGEINALTKSELTEAESTKLSGLIGEYGDLAHKLGTD